jgi:hypothetical protein
MSVQERTIKSGRETLHTATERIVQLFEAIGDYGGLPIPVNRAAPFAESLKATEGKPMATRGTWQCDPAP